MFRVLVYETQFVPIPCVFGISWQCGMSVEMLQKCKSVCLRKWCLTVIVGSAKLVLIRPSAGCTVGLYGSAPFAQLVLEVPLYTYISTNVQQYDTNHWY